ncbi:3'-5' ssDNA/RNA exonuclease TatD-like [Ruditapes philippinarum]|uniref:3'-5' ssDNA/RNA exonuclease TatD-like n=1 Tax=Ruditapes philippinarum TaxID=129788 RepID=UPI00295BFD01|nr:3'-5' ssDNA/RNA exonuclease TatD-like [Ruditapes philippinarum]
MTQPASPLSLIRIPRGFGIAVGIHPKQSHQFYGSLLENIRQLLRNSRVVAMGEIGLDYTTPENTWSYQEHVFTRMLSLAPSSMPVILSLRDWEHGNAYLKRYDILMRNSAPVQKVHLHCFTGSAEAVIKWNQMFPNCYFGLTALVRNLGTGQREAVQ